MTETTQAPPTSSEYAEQLAKAGAHPIEVSDDTIKAMLAQMEELQRKVDQMNVERGVPLDRVDGYIQQLKAHFQTRKNSRQDTDFAAPETALAKLPENPDEVTAAHTEALHFAFSQWLKQHPGKELDYLETLAGELHGVVLDREGKHGVMHQRVAELEDQLAQTTGQLNQMAGQKTVPLTQFQALEQKVNELLARPVPTAESATNG